ncbi:hypothetical protein PCASD_12673 [Puccinia coronata f. sp. avenae]|uniref:Uncharacterized protein n=1 Tax=Puccinia coronata f. sp. avenae TaxID=200324 RepID=A0A2N5UDZ2_9BASI|nr:hypothetical protein PCASD_12673 [Puccinia coronata f. sp. avenae]
MSDNKTSSSSGKLPADSPGPVTFVELPWSQLSDKWTKPPVQTEVDAGQPTSPHSELPTAPKKANPLENNSPAPSDSRPSPAVDGFYPRSGKSASRSTVHIIKLRLVSDPLSPLCGLRPIRAVSNIPARPCASPPSFSFTSACAWSSQDK